MSNPVLTGEPAAGRLCRVCSGVLTETLRCTRCGAAYGEGNRCPHCHSVTDVEPNDALRHRCRVCGGARIPLEDSEVERSGREIAVLARAQSAHVRGALWRVGSGVVAGFGLLSLAVSLLVIFGVGPSLVGALALVAATAVPFFVAAFAWLRAGRQTKDRDVALDEAWGLVAADVVAQKGRELTAGELAKILRTTEAHAEQLLAALSVTDFVHARVTEQGDLAYSPDEKIRVETRDEAAVEEQDEAQVRAHARAEEKPR